MLHSRTNENKLECKKQIVNKIHPDLRMTEIRAG